MERWRHLPGLRQRLVVTGLALALWRLLAHVALPFTNPHALYPPPPPWATSDFLVGLFSLRDEGLSVIAMGTNPYINAWLVMRLMSIVSASVGRLRLDEPDRYGRWIRYVTVGMASLQAFGLTTYFQNTTPPSLYGPLTWFAQVATIVAMVCGAMLVVWIADLLDEYGLGFGIGIWLLWALHIAVVRPQGDAAFVTAVLAAGPRALVPWVLILVATCVVSVAAVWGGRRVMLAPRKQAAAKRRVMPIPFMVGGVLMPPILTLGIMASPTIVSNYLAYGSGTASMSAWILRNWTPDGPTLAGDVVYDLAWAAVMIGLVVFGSRGLIPPESIGEWLDRAGLTIAAASPDRSPVYYFEGIWLRMALYSGALLAVFSILLPAATPAITGLPQSIAYFDAINVLRVVAVMLAFWDRFETAARDPRSLAEEEQLLPGRFAARPFWRALHLDPF